MLPYRLGCPSWSEAAWRGALYPERAPAADYLALYARVFNAVEGNTTFYAQPTSATVQRWAQRMPDDFRFCAKLPREISHSADLRRQLGATQSFLELLAPLGERVAPFWLQLPAAFGPSRLGELADFLVRFEPPLAVEVRHPAFFQRGEEERALNRLLRDAGVERLCLDARALFSCRDDTPAVRHAQAKKPRLPVRPAAFTAFPQVRFIGHPELAANDPFLAPWLDKVAAWIEEGRRPHVFLHTPDNRRAPELARRFHEQLGARLPGLPALAAFGGSQLDLL
ncbi:DUF72 domain-containing protein [Azotobacter beijerinckii]|uniref:Uncharacterized conserved protein YecE, DUF72 family n=1 Tax=Azotobacter beijerinckii TaxID=170623 RepID=A0A1I3YZV5_9GAMM|nr:DUF72 domain-containing protein [Azotobacter beijerinckii]SFA74600.1 Uncharacterized conserved protein YecE, DUF72 family [Azotobacter beijerinckii]SFK37338.1 Uncharacterized conserved protein YecE, DUF72 family [Azotobacter beijerinckii]